MTTIATIVEGDGEVQTMRIVISRILLEIGVYPHVPKPHRLPRSKVTSFESIFLAAAASLTAKRHFTDATPVRRPETKRGAKEMVRHRLGASYKPVLHQPRLTEAMDLGEAEQCRWFAKLRRDIVGLAGHKL